MSDGPPGRLQVYVGTYTSGAGGGIHRLELDPVTGRLSPAGAPVEALDPSFLVLHPNGRLLYAVNETGAARGDTGGTVSAFAVDAASGGLTLLGRQASEGAAPCFLSTDAGGRHLFVANYWGASVAVLPIEPGGRLAPAACVRRFEGRGADPRRQEAPHPHSIQLDPTGRFALVADLGQDKLLVFRFDPETGALRDHEPAACALPGGAGPRHLAFDPQGRCAYLVGELASTVTVLACDLARGRFEPVQTVSTLPAGADGDGNAAAEVAVRADGRFLYASNRGHDSIAVFSIDAATGRLDAAGHAAAGGRTPRHFALDPTGTHLLVAHQESDSVAVFRIDAGTGGLAPTGASASLPRPACVRTAGPLRRTAGGGLSASRR